MEPLLLVIVSMKSAVMLFSAGVLLKLFGRRNPSTVLIASFLALYGMINIDGIFHEAGFYQFYPHLLGIIFPFTFLLCPLLYWYVLSIDGKRTASNTFSSINRRSFAFCAPAVAVLVALPFYTLSAEDKLQLISGNPASSEHYEWALLGCSAGFAMFTILSIIYLVAAYRHVFSARISSTTLSTCVKGVLLVVTLGWGLSSIAEFIAIQSAVGTGFRNAYHLFELTWLILLASLSFKTEQALEQRRAASIEFNKQPPKTTGTLLTQAQQKDIAQMLKTEMQTNQLFLDPELTLSALAKRTELREQIISETLNSYLEQNFFEFVNSYRIYYACERIKDASTSISNIAIEAGFNSRTTFYSAFKRIKGCTPSEYRMALANHKTCSNGTI